MVLCIVQYQTKIIKILAVPLEYGNIDQILGCSITPKLTYTKTRNIGKLQQFRCFMWEGDELAWKSTDTNLWW